MNIGLYNNYMKYFSSPVLYFTIIYVHILIIMLLHVYTHDKEGHCKLVRCRPILNGLTFINKVYYYYQYLSIRTLHSFCVQSNKKTTVPKLVVLTLSVRGPYLDVRI